jgi:hypothetical protein
MADAPDRPVLFSLPPIIAQKFPQADPLAETRVRSLWLVGWAAGPDPSADLLDQLDDDPRRATDVAEPVAVFMTLQLADELRVTGSQADDDGADVFDGECDSLLLAVRAGRGRVQWRRSDPLGAGCLWGDVLVDVEEVAGIVGPLDLDQPVVVLAVVVPDLVVVVVLHEVDVAAGL